MNCRNCGTPLNSVFLDLGTAPPSNAYLTEDELNAPETWFPLRIMVCESCWLVQTEDYAGREVFFDQDYAYFSSFSTSWLAHSKTYVEKMVGRFNLGPKSLVMEVAANDGYLLQYVRDAGIPCYGIEPTASTAVAARLKGIEIVEEFFGSKVGRNLAVEGRQVDLVAANNVLAHVPDINDFVAGFTAILKPSGVATFEFPHLLRMVQENQFDTAYHEHFSYLSFTVVERIMVLHGLTVFDVEEIPTHGGSLRVFAQRSDTGPHEMFSTVPELLGREVAAGICTPQFYEGFQPRVVEAKMGFLRFLLDMREQGHKVVAYGAAAKGNTLLNFAGIRSDLIAYVVDRNLSKQGKYLPGSHIPIVSEEVLMEDQPNIVVVLPWNLIKEISLQLAYVREWGGRIFRGLPTIAEEV
jgi:SAM-dependent methyltransferase